MKSQKNRFTYSNGCRKYDIEIGPSARLYELLYLMFFLTQGILKFRKLCKHIKNEKKLTLPIARYFMFRAMINFIVVLISLIYEYISMFLTMLKITFIIDDTD